MFLMTLLLKSKADAFNKRKGWSFNVFINKQLFVSDIKFRKYCTISRDLFNNILHFIKKR
jgi:hypothetical protein